MLDVFWPGLDWVGADFLLLGLIVPVLGFGDVTECRRLGCGNSFKLREWAVLAVFSCDTHTTIISRWQKPEEADLTTVPHQTQTTIRFGHASRFNTRYLYTPNKKAQNAEEKG